MIKNTKFIYCITNCYVRALIHEVQNYESFLLKCYCSVAEGIRNLKYTNMSEILGFIILLDNVGETDEDFFDLVDLINSINLESSNTTVVLALRDSTGYEDLEEEIELNNIKLYLIDGIEMMTDTIIKRDLFGTILREEYNPYLDNKVKKIVEFTEPVTSSVSPIFPPSIEKLITPVVVAPNLRLALENDEVFNSIHEGDDVAYFLRSEQINKIYGNFEDRSEMLEGILKNNTDGLNDVYRSVYELIKRGDL